MLVPKMLVPKLQLGNPAREAPASRNLAKLELGGLRSQAGAWERAYSERAY